MKKRFFCLLISLMFTATSHAGGGADVQILHGENGFAVGTAEFFWSKGRFSGFGFYDRYSHGALGYFAEHSLEYNLNDYFFVSGEIGSSTFGDAQKAGVGVNVGRLFKHERSPFVYFDVTYYTKVWGVDVKQIEVSWLTKSLSIGESVSVYLSGFANFRNGAPDVKQPQLWFTFGDSRFEVGVELDMFGDRKTPLIAVKYNF